MAEEQITGGSGTNPSKKAKASKKKSPKKAAGKPKPHRVVIGKLISPLQSDLGSLLAELEDELGRPILMLWHDGKRSNPFGSLNGMVQEVFCSNFATLPDKPVAIVVNSPGGLADVAYRLARLIQQRCGSYMVLVPRWAKSAATLFALGADSIVLGRFGELGPLDAQITDFEREEERSALEVVQAVERLNREAMSAIDQQMVFWMPRALKKIDTLLPVASHFVAEMMRPMFEKIDTVEFTKNARSLKVAQDYAVRLLKGRYDRLEAEEISLRLANDYSEHGFVIDTEEAQALGLNCSAAEGKVGTILEKLAFGYNELNEFGLFARSEK